uniref:Kinesin motor domain-containing protein n=1 Tax=Angiostrongylus cantonensis TaxID=6313 RepID=A0A0K0D7R5_ANGCA
LVRSVRICAALGRLQSGKQSEATNLVSPAFFASRTIRFDLLVRCTTL